MSDFKKDYYGILEVFRSAGVDEIRLSYRRLVKRYHPDLHPGNTEYENRIKDINEAYHVLGNENERHAYDRYLLYKEAQEKKSAAAPGTRNKRTYRKTAKVYAEEKTYVKGDIHIKYVGDHDEREAGNILRETFYKIRVTQTLATIRESYPRDMPKEFEDLFAAHQPTGLAIRQPVNCKVTSNGTEAHYLLEILQLTIPDPEISLVTKHEDQSFGTITGTFYGYVKKDISYDRQTEVTECFGETGSTETRTENGVQYYRKEYFNTDCTRYWGDWIVIMPRSSARRPSAQQRAPGRVYAFRASGCAGTLGKLAGIGFGLVFFLALLPHLAFLLPFFLLPFLINLFSLRIWNGVLRGIGILFLLFFMLAIIAGLTNRKQTRQDRAESNPGENRTKPGYTPLINPRPDQEASDVLIAHHIQWDDYDGRRFEGSFSVKKSAFERAHHYKNGLDLPVDSESNYDRVIFLLKEYDKEQLAGLYAMFDSIRLADRPGRAAFAETIVSCIQSIPYALVSPQACNAQLYQDEFTSRYLSSPDARCDGHERYGIKTPVEFLVNLKGDCDTRTLLLYTVLSHYDYDVALLSSEYYSHSTLGINLPYEGFAYNYHNQRYVFWETTSPSTRPGILPNAISDTDRWRISLKSK